MGAESKSLLEQWLEAGDAGDVDAFHEFLHEDVVVHAPLGLSSRGIEQEKDVWRAALRAISDLHHEVHEVISAGASTAARVVVTGTLVEELGGVSPSGAPFRLDQVVWASLRDERAVEVWEIADVGVLLRSPS